VRIIAPLERASVKSIEDMIDGALSHVVWQLNQHLRRTFLLEEDFAVLSNIVEQDGSLVPLVANKLVVFLVGIEQETAAHSSAEHARAGSSDTVHWVEPVFLNLLVMCAANFGGANYSEALKLLSGAIGFFQINAVLDHHNCPELDDRVERISFEIENLGLDQLHNLWGIHSGRYIPSVLYRLRMVSVDPNQANWRIPLIRQTENNVCN